MLKAFALMHLKWPFSTSNFRVYLYKKMDFADVHSSNKMLSHATNGRQIHISFDRLVCVFLCVSVRNTLTEQAHGNDWKITKMEPVLIQMAFLHQHKEEKRRDENTKLIHLT